MNFFPSLLLLSHILLVKSSYDYYDYYDCDSEYSDYFCEDDFCTEKTQYVSLERETETPIRDTNLIAIDSYYDYFYVLKESGIRECSPSLEIKVTAN